MDRCEMRDVLDRVGDKWTVLVVTTLGTGPHRFNELRRRCHGITQRMLSVTLRGLERDGLIRRSVHPTVPPKVEYDLTVAGRRLLDAVTPLLAWAEAHVEEVRAARAAYDRAAS